MLIITYYWPPSGGIGVLRCLKIAKYLRQFGWEPVVFTAENAHYPGIDHSNDRDIPPGITVLRRRIWEPYHIYKFLTGKKKEANVNNVFYVQESKPGLMHRFSVWVRSNFFIPDARALWIRPSVRFLLDYLRNNPVDAIFSDGPPHTNTRIATLIKKAAGIPWLADFQDPWTQVDYYQLLHLTPWGDSRHRRMEQEAFQYADHISIVSPTWKSDLERIGARNITVIPWGFDPDDYSDLPAPDGKSFSITHTGILGYDRNPPAFFQALKQLCETEPGFRERLELRIVGQVDRSVREAISEAGLETLTRFTGPVSRLEALRFTASSTVLLLLLNRQPNTRGRIPGKLFEYLAVRRPLIVLGPRDADASRIAAETGAGQAFDYDDAASIGSGLASLFRQFTAGKLQAPINSEIGEFSIDRLTGRVASILDAIQNIAGKDEA